MLKFHNEQVLSVGASVCTYQLQPCSQLNFKFINNCLELTCLPQAIKIFSARPGNCLELTCKPQTKKTSAARPDNL